VFKKLSIGVCLFFLFFPPGYSGIDEEAWRWQYPIPQGNTLRAAHFSAEAGIAVGDCGTIIRTSDGGRSWSYVSNPFAQHIQGVCHLGKGRWLAVGGKGLIIASDDDGRTWNRIRTDSRTDLFGVEFVTPEIGAAIGSEGTILWSEDGGISWRPKSSGVDVDLRAIAFLTAEKAVIVGRGGVILKTIDSGKTWVQKKAAMDLFAVRFTDENSGYAAGGNLGYLKNRRMILRTTDGGESWQAQQKKRGPVLYSLSFFGQNDLLACGQSGALIHGSDGGSRWANLKSPTEHTLSSVVFSGEKGVAVGSYGTIITTVDGGKTWTAQQPDKQKAFGSVSFADAAHGLVVGDEGTLLWTSDGGATWTGSAAAPSRYIRSGCLLNAQKAVALGTSGAVFRTLDGGATWEQVKTGVDTWLGRVNFADESTGVAVGYSTIITTEDGGRTWTRRAVPRRVGDCRLLDVACAGQDRWLAVGALGVIITSGDGGRTWSQEESGTKKILRAVAWSDPLTATVVGDGGLILQYVDGSGWSERKSGTTRRLFGVGYVNRSMGFAVGDFGTILRTDDGGKAWRAENSHTSNHLYGLSCAWGRIFAVGWNATILQRQVEQTAEGDN
jgi:photosystem II stability/assembly factor-like uncharacterized protein